MPSGLAIGPSGEMFVSDGYGAHRVHKYNADGELLLTWGRQGTGPGEFALVHNVWVDKDSRVLICDRENDRIQIFDDQGGFLEEWTDLEKPGDIWIHDDVVHVVEQGPGSGDKPVDAGRRPDHPLARQGGPGQGHHRGRPRAVRGPAGQHLRYGDRRGAARDQVPEGVEGVHPHPRIEYGAGSLPPSSGKGLADASGKV